MFNFIFIIVVIYVCIALTSALEQTTHQSINQSSSSSSAASISSSITNIISSSSSSNHSTYVSSSSSLLSSSIGPIINQSSSSSTGASNTTFGSGEIDLPFAINFLIASAIIVALTFFVLVSRFRETQLDKQASSHSLKQSDLTTRMLSEEQVQAHSNFEWLIDWLIRIVDSNSV